MEFCRYETKIHTSTINSSELMSLHICDKFIRYSKTTNSFGFRATNGRRNLDRKWRFGFVWDNHLHYHPNLPRYYIINFLLT